MEVLLGIDFGTTNTVISYFSNNKSIILMDGIFKTIPSKIAKINDKYYCGNYIPIYTNKDIDNIQKDLTTNDASSSKSLNFSNVDLAITSEGTKKEVDAPKDIETLNNISKINQEKRRLEDELGDDDEKISIGEDINLAFDIVDLSGKSKSGDQEVELTDVEIL